MWNAQILSLPATNIIVATFRVSSIPFFPYSSAGFQLEQVLFTTSICMNASSYSHDYGPLNVFLSMQKLFSCMPFFPSPPGERTCSSSEFTCPIWYPGHPRCVPLNFVCDGERDCVNAADELQNCANRTCHMDEFACSNGLCILIPYQ